MGLAWTDKPAYEPAPPVDRNPWYVAPCPCHGLPRTFAGGAWRCVVKLKATNDRYRTSEKCRAVHRRHNARRTVRARLRVTVAGRRIYMHSEAQCSAARAFIRKRRNQWRSECLSRETAGKNAS